ncbi:hypothetical protein [Prescottella agglutinans]|uniref:hypothetical protein n=1 Tax=Prescottella agglutinans TaxID=1644129 RepID=UPI003D95B626
MEVEGDLRTRLLCALAGQKGTPEAWIVAVDSGGHECVCPAVYDSSTDTVRMHYTPTPDDVFDVAVVDGMLLHALGHRARRAHARILRWLGWTLTAAAVAFVHVVVFRDTHNSSASLTTPLQAVLGAFAVVGALLVAAWIRYHWTAEPAADAYALEHGGPRPILTFLRRMVGDPVSEAVMPRARPGHGITRLQARLWANSTLGTSQAGLQPIAEPGFRRPRNGSPRLNGSDSST